MGFGNKKEEEKSDDSMDKVKGFFISAFNTTATISKQVKQKNIFYQDFSFIPLPHFPKIIGI